MSRRPDPQGPVPCRPVRRVRTRRSLRGRVVGQSPRPGAVRASASRSICGWAGASHFRTRSLATETLIPLPECCKNALRTPGHQWEGSARESSTSTRPAGADAPADRNFCRRLSRNRRTRRQHGELGGIRQRQARREPCKRGSDGRERSQGGLREHRPLGVEKQMNARAGEILAACGRSPSRPPTGSIFSSLAKIASSPDDYGGVDVNTITGGEGASPHVTQSETQVWAQGNTVVAAFNDSRTAPSCYSGGSYSTNGGANWTNLNTRPFCTGHGTGFGDPVVYYDVEHRSGSRASSPPVAEARGSAFGSRSTGSRGRLGLARTPAAPTTASRAGSTTTRPAPSSATST